jgi:G3E family GTPase
VLIENEFGEIGIDGGFLKDAGIEIREMNSGCICCSLVGDFGTALIEVVEKYHPDRIIIEPSGVGKLSDVIKAVEGVKDKCEIALNSYTTVADVKKCKMYLRNFGEFFSNQIEYAGTVVLSRTDLADEKKVKEACELIRGLNEKAHIITTPVEELEPAQLKDIMENKKADLAEELLKEAHEHHHHEHDEDCTCGCHDHDHDHEHHHHDHDEECHDHEHHHHHDHDEECHDHEHHHHHDHDEECHDHDHEHHHHHDHDEECHDHDHEHHHHDHDHEHDENCTCGCHDHDHDHHHGHHHADEVFTSWGKETAKKYSREELEHILAELSGDNDTYGIVLRAKGMLPDAEGEWHYFDMVPEETEIRTGAPEYTGRICVIGSKLKEEKLTELFGL